MQRLGEVHKEGKIHGRGSSRLTEKVPPLRTGELVLDIAASDHSEVSDPVGIFRSDVWEQYRAAQLLSVRRKTRAQQQQLPSSRPEQGPESD